MTIHAITVPKWGLSMEEGMISSWLATDGSQIEPGNEIADIETSKITNALEASAGGVLRHLVAEGETLPVGALIGILVDGGESEAEVADFIAAYTAGAEEAAEAAAAVNEPVTVTVEGKSIKYLHCRSARDEARLPVILLHGFGGDHTGWTLNQEALSGARDVYALDLPGHGGSAKDVDDGSFEALANSVVGWMDAVGLEKAHLIGHSMGAGVALTIALRAPERVGTLVAINGAGFGGQLNRDYVEGFVSADNRRQLKPVIELLFADPGLVTRAMVDDLVSYKRIDGVSQALRSLIDGALSSTSLATLESARDALRVPHFAVVGGKDQVVCGTPAPASDAGFIVPGAGHMPHLEAAAEVNNRIAAFLLVHD